MGKALGAGADAILIDPEDAVAYPIPKRPLGIPSLASSLRSSPEQNPSPLPVSSGSLSRLSMALRKPRDIDVLMALFWSGRLSVMMRTRPRTSVRTALGSITVSAVVISAESVSPRRDAAIHRSCSYSSAPQWPLWRIHLTVRGGVGIQRWLRVSP